MRSGQSKQATILAVTFTHKTPALKMSGMLLLPVLFYFLYTTAVFAEDVPDEVQAIFNASCTNGCHITGTENGGLNLEDATTSFAELFEVSASCDATKKRVADRDAINSVLYAKVIGAPDGCGGVMPPSGNLISANDQVVIKNWIDTLHPNGQINFSNASQNPIIGETGSTVTLDVSRGPGTQGEVSVDYATADGTATAATDYVASSGTLAFADGQTTQQIVITILDDADIEGDENFFVNLSNVAGGADPGTAIRSTVTIADDDDPPSPGILLMNNQTLNVNENAGTVDIIIRRASGNEGAVSVMLNSADGSALAGEDYQSLSQQVSFADAENTKSVTLTILDDQTFEGNETLSLSLSSPGGNAVIGSPSNTTVTIIEDDPDPNTGTGNGGGTPPPPPSTTTDPDSELKPESIGAVFWLLVLLPLIRIFKK